MTPGRAENLEKTKGFCTFSHMGRMMAQIGGKMAARWPKIAPRGFQEGSKRAPGGSKEEKEER